MWMILKNMTIQTIHSVRKYTHDQEMLMLAELYKIPHEIVKINGKTIYQFDIGNVKEKHMIDFLIKLNNK